MESLYQGKVGHNGERQSKGSASALGFWVQHQHWGVFSGGENLRLREK